MADGFAIVFWPTVGSLIIATGGTIAGLLAFEGRTPFVTDPALWTPDRQLVLVFAAALTAWWGYLFAHVAWTGTLVDQSAHNEEVEYEIESNLGTRVQQIGVILGVSILVCGMVIGVVYIRNGNPLLTNLGGILFLGGSWITHFIETGEPL